MTDPRTSFEQKAPLVDLNELTDLIVGQILTRELRERAESVWIRSSFADPERGIDSTDKLSDLDVFVVVPGWEHPAADSGLALVAPQADISTLYEDPENVTWTSKGGKCDSPEDAWEMIPQCVRETLRRSVRHGFYATESDLESDSVRPFDLTIDSRETYETIREPSAEFCIWRSES